MHSVQAAAKIAFATTDLDWREYGETDDALIRPADVDVVCADYTKTRRDLRWEPTVNFEELMRIMIISALLSPSST